MQRTQRIYSTHTRTHTTTTTIPHHNTHSNTTELNTHNTTQHNTKHISVPILSLPHICLLQDRLPSALCMARAQMNPICPLPPAAFSGSLPSDPLPFQATIKPNPLPKPVWERTLTSQCRYTNEALQQLRCLAAPDAQHSSSPLHRDPCCCTEREWGLPEGPQVTFPKSGRPPCRSPCKPHGSTPFT
eukprot:GGOE01023574.1.p1 GENE.GGOE01023574.1~~GGOE01023574.1.p1  ORF type:complete len:187 (+),score=16.03 GGOE01023574.1:362-922(+)